MEGSAMEGVGEEGEICAVRGERDGDGEGEMEGGAGADTDGA